MMDLSVLKNLSVGGVAVKTLFVNGIQAFKSGYKNWVPCSIDTDGSIYNGTGYLEGYRLSSSGVIKSREGSVVTGYIPAKAGDVVRIAGVAWYQTHSMNYICAYTSSFTYIGAVYSPDGSYGSKIYTSLSDENGTTIITLADLDQICYIRVSSVGDNTGIDAEDFIVTVNVKIEE